MRVIEVECDRAPIGRGGLCPRMLAVPTTRWQRLATSPLSSRGHRVLAILGLVAALNALDLALTLRFMLTSGLYEANPLVRAIVAATGSAAALTVFKAVCVGVSIGMLVPLRRLRQAEIAAWCSLGVMIWVTVRWHLYCAAVRGISAGAECGPSDGLVVVTRVL